MTTASRAERREALDRYQNDAEPLADFIARVTPKYTPLPAHLKIITDLIEETRHRSIYATISVPPRGGKTETLAHGLAWRTLMDPACLNFYATFGDDLTQQTSRRVRAIVRAEGLRDG